MFGFEEIELWKVTGEEEMEITGTGGVEEDTITEGRRL